MTYTVSSLLHVATPMSYQQMVDLNQEAGDSLWFILSEITYTSLTTFSISGCIFLLALVAFIRLVAFAASRCLRTWANNDNIGLLRLGVLIYYLTVLLFFMGTEETFNLWFAAVLTWNTLVFLAVAEFILHNVPLSDAALRSPSIPHSELGFKLPSWLLRFFVSTVVIGIFDTFAKLSQEDMTFYQINVFNMAYIFVAVITQLLASAMIYWTTSRILVLSSPARYLIYGILLLNLIHQASLSTYWGITSIVAESLRFVVLHTAADGLVNLIGQVVFYAVFAQILLLIGWSQNMPITYGTFVSQVWHLVSSGFSTPRYKMQNTFIAGSLVQSLLSYIPNNTGQLFLVAPTAHPGICNRYILSIVNQMVVMQSVKSSWFFSDRVNLNQWVSVGQLPEVYNINLSPTTVEQVPGLMAFYKHIQDYSTPVLPNDVVIHDMYYCINPISRIEDLPTK